MSVILERSEGKKVIIGDHTLVTVLGVRDNSVRLAFDSVDKVNRVDNPKMLRVASEIEAAASRTVGRRADPMLEPPIYLAYHDEGYLMGATLSQEVMHSFGGDLEIETVKSMDDILPNGPSLLLIRVTARRDAEVLKAATQALGPNLTLRSMAELEDGMIYMLYQKAGDKRRLTRLDLAAVHGR